jgi:mRNA-degrading endonuclease toxin of MazEF toxin-antitoxin module
MADRTIQRGDIWIADLGYAGKIRPVLIISVPPTDRERALHIVMAHTTTLWSTQYEVAIPHPALQAGAFDAQQVFLLPPVKLVRRVGTLSRPDMARIEAALTRVLGLSSVTG